MTDVLIDVSNANISLLKGAGHSLHIINKGLYSAGKLHTEVPLPLL